MMLAKLVFYPFLAYNYVLTKVTSQTWYNRIDNNVILGALAYKCLTNQIEDWAHLSHSFILRRKEPPQCIGCNCSLTVKLLLKHCIDLKKHQTEALHCPQSEGTWDAEVICKYVGELIEKEKIKGIVSLNEDYELHLAYKPEELKVMGIEFLQLSTVDFTGTPSQEHIVKGVQFLNRHRVQGNSVYVHCKAGRTRSATLVVCYFIQLYNWTPQKAVDFVRSKRPIILLNDLQLKSIEDYSKSLKRS